MSQTPPQVCPNCKTLVDQESRFCPNCGTAVASESMAPTASSSPYGPNPTPPFPYPPGPSNPNLPPPAPTQLATSAVQPPTPVGTQYGIGNTPPPPSYMPQAYSNPVPAPPTDPYLIPNYAPPQQKKRSPVPFVIIGIVVVLLLACGGGFYVIGQAFNSINPNHNTITGNGGNGSGNNAQSSVTLNLTTVYSSDQITFTKIEQQTKFSDDNLTTYNDHANYVRLDFGEQQLSKHGSFFGYYDAFHLTLPNKTVVNPVNSKESTGPDQAVVRTNWVDFPTDSQVDLNNLTVTLGTSDEAQMTVPLKNNADLSTYQPKTTNPNTKFHYAMMDWTLTSATQSLYFAGKQAKSGQVYVTVNLTIDNNSQDDIFLYSFARLKANDSAISPDYNSDMNSFENVKAGNTNVQGSLTFLTQSASKYTLDFLANTDSSSSWPEQTVDFQIS